MEVLVYFSDFLTAFLTSACIQYEKCTKLLALTAGVQPLGNILWTSSSLNRDTSSHEHEREKRETSYPEGVEWKHTFEMSFYLSR